MVLETTMTVVPETVVKVRMRMVAMVKGWWGCS